MVRRISTTLAALAIALVFYTVFTGLIFHRITTKLIQTNPLHNPQTCPTCRANAQPGVPVPMLRVRIPVSVLVAAAVTILAMPLFAHFMTYLRRRRRFLNDQCVDCGYQLTSWRGRCPACGVRVGPG